MPPRIHLLTYYSSGNLFGSIDSSIGRRREDLNSSVRGRGFNEGAPHDPTPSPPKSYPESLWTCQPRVNGNYGTTSGFLAKTINPKGDNSLDPKALRRIRLVPEPTHFRSIVEGMSFERIVGYVYLFD